MSVRLIGQVWTLDLSHSKQAVLLALADHAQDDGSSVYPSVGYLAWKTGYSERNVRRILRVLERDHLITPVAPASQHRAVEYRLQLANGRPKAPFNPTPRADKMSSLPDPQGGQVAHSRGTTGTARADMAVSPEPSLTVREPYGGGSGVAIDPPSVARLTDRYRTILGVQRQERDGARVAGLAKQYGYAQVATALENHAAQLGQARKDPLAFLAAILKREASERATADRRREETSRLQAQSRRDAATAGRSPETDATWADLRQRIGARSRFDLPTAQRNARGTAKRAGVTCVGDVFESPEDVLAVAAAETQHCSSEEIPPVTRMTARR